MSGRILLPRRISHPDPLRSGQSLHQNPLDGTGRHMQLRFLVQRQQYQGCPGWLPMQQGLLLPARRHFPHSLSQRDLLLLRRPLEQWHRLRRRLPPVRSGEVLQWPGPHERVGRLRPGLLLPRRKHVAFPAPLHCRPQMRSWFCRPGSVQPRRIPKRIPQRLLRPLPCWVLLPGRFACGGPGDMPRRVFLPERHIRLSGQPLHHRNLQQRNWGIKQHFVFAMQGRILLSHW